MLAMPLIVASLTVRKTPDGAFANVRLTSVVAAGSVTATLTAIGAGFAAIETTVGVPEPSPPPPQAERRIVPLQTTAPKIFVSREVLKLCIAASLPRSVPRVAMLNVVLGRH